MAQTILILLLIKLKMLILKKLH